MLPTPALEVALGEHDFDGFDWYIVDSITCFKEAGK
jgi:hypothetical protein